MYEFQHENLLTLLGYSIDGPNYCLVYHYMPNGSLESRLALKVASELLINHPYLIIPLSLKDAKPLEWNQRFDIANGVARGSTA